MREIKFRGKTIESKEWVHGSYRYRDLMDGHFIEDIEVNPQTVGQFIDFYDKNNIPIYEGDIIEKCNYRNGNYFIERYLVVFDEGSYCLAWRDETYTVQYMGFGYSIANILDKEKIIGNIFDDKERFIKDFGNIV